MVSADIDNDQDEDFLACHPDNPRLFELTEEGGERRYVDATATQFESTDEWNAAPDHVFAAAWGDYNQDGWIDLAVVGRIDSLQVPDVPPPGYQGGVANLILYRNVGGVLKFTSAAATVVGDQGFIPEDPRVMVRWIDPDANGRPDILVADLSGPEFGLRIFKNMGYTAAAGDYEFSDETATWFGADRGPDGVVSARVFDLEPGDDNVLDLALARSGESDNLLIYRNTGTHYELVDKPASQWGGFSSDLSDVIVWDFDRNGREDLVAVQTGAMELPRILMGGLRSIGQMAEVYPSGFARGDYRRGLAATWGNGSPSLLLAKATVEPSSQGFMYGFSNAPETEGNAYTKIRIGDNGSINGSAAGTALSLSYFKDGESVATVLRRWIDGGAGRGSQNVREVEFGLGAYSGTTVDLKVRWPDGTTELFGEVPVTSPHMIDPASVPVGPEVAVIEKTTRPLAFVPRKIGKQYFNATATFMLGTEDENWWVFEWDMNSQGKCWIEFDYNDMPSGCECMCTGDPAILELGTPFVEYDVTPVGNLLYRHRLVWKGRCCFQNCSYTYRVKGQLGATVASSGNLTASTGSVCTSGF